MSPSVDVSARVLASAPPTLPVAIRLSVMRYVLGSRRKESVVNIIFGVLFVALGLFMAFASDETAGGDARELHLGGWLMVAGGIVVLGYLPVLAARQLKDGFSVGADASGIFLRPNMDKNRVLFLPWSAVEVVRVARWRGPQLVVRPHDKRLEPGFAMELKGRWENRLGTEIAQRLRIRRLGTNIHAPIPGVDTVQLLNDLRYQAAGRAPIESPGGNPVML